MTTQSIPWKAAPDVFVVTRPASRFMNALEGAAAKLAFESSDHRCRFVAHARVAQANEGPALVVTDIAEYDTGMRQTAVVVSAVVYSDRAGERLVVIRTHLEDQHTRHDDHTIVFEEHHDQIRAALTAAVLEVEPGALHRTKPTPPGNAVDDVVASTPGPQGQLRIERARPRPVPVMADTAHSRIDIRQAAGMLFLVVGVVVLLLAIAFGSLPLILAGIGAAGLLGYAGNRIAGV